MSGFLGAAEDFSSVHFRFVNDSDWQFIRRAEYQVGFNSKEQRSKLLSVDLDEEYMVVPYVFKLAYLALNILVISILENLNMVTYFSYFYATLVNRMKGYFGSYQ